MKTLFPNVRKLASAALLCTALAFAVGAVPQGRGRRVGLPIPVPAGGVGIPRVPGVGRGIRQTCVQSCNGFHNTEKQICKGRTGRDRASCQQSINQQHRLCIQSCPR